MKVSRDDVKQAIFGSGDGAVTTLGIIATLWVSGHKPAILLGVVGGTLSATISMGWNEYIADEQSSVHRALMMSFGTLLGGIWPALPLFFGRSSITLVLVAALITVLGSLFVWVKVRDGHPLSRATTEVYGMFVTASAITVLAGLLAPGSS